ncbi:pilus assembly protein PilX [Acinetobacter sp. MB5]|uniref:pilus assembly protein PilX n=1 Tax=Acinetobacter sp. MB5 TaxID=2069438 RepID=UPI000DCFAF1C|nr:pilus assembly protein PilX [Acinetobacter sp. MB5]
MISRRSQQGATLVVVLIVLLLITIIGTLAIRQGLLSLNIATNGQAQQLMLTNSDSAIFTVQDADNLSQELATNGMFGYIRTSSNKGKELVFCYRGTNTNFFTIANASIIKWETGTAPNNSEIGTAGYCNPTSSNNYYTSGRGAVMTQITVQFEDSSSDDTPFSGSVSGTDTDSAKVMSSEKALVHAVSLMPTLSSASTSDIYSCLSTHMNDPEVPSGYTAASGADESVSECLADLNVPFTTHVSEYTLTQSLTSSS